MTTIPIPFHRLYSTYACQRNDSIICDGSAYIRTITSALDKPERTHAVGSLAGQVVDGLVGLDNLRVRARACQVVDLLASCR